MCILMNIESMDAFKCLYIMIIYARVGLTPLYSVLVLFPVVERANC